MKSLKSLPIFNYRELSYRQKLAVIYILTGLLMSSLAFVMNFFFDIPFWMNIPNLVIMLMCIIFISLLPEKIEKFALVIIYLFALLYIPFNYFINGGYNGASPLYFVMIIAYFALYTESMKSTIFTTILLSTIYTSIMILSFHYPNLVITYTDESSVLIDNIFGVLAAGISLVIVSHLTLNRYIYERDQNINLVKSLEVKNTLLEELSSIDHLTGVYQRQTFFGVLEDKLNLIKKTDEKISLMMIDVDHFKTINDTWGHQYGDDILKKIADTIKNSLPNNDVIGRYGGEEFIVLTKFFSEKSTFDLAERLRKRVSEITAKEKHVATISIGVTNISPNDDVKDIIFRADTNLYKAKASGRNKTVYE